MSRNGGKSAIYQLQILVKSLYQFLSPECNCNLQGSKNNKCSPDTGNCDCKDGYSGINCDFDFTIGKNLCCSLNSVKIAKGKFICEK